MNRIVSLALWIVAATGLSARQFDLGTTAEITSATLHVLHENARPTGVLVFVAGFGIDGAGLARDPLWVSACEENRWAWVAVNFTSSLDDANAHRGFTNAARGSGEMLLRGLKLAGYEGQPLFVIGYSSGAQFTWSFVHHAGDVRAWCLYAASSFEPRDRPPLPTPGLLVCGVQDSRRFEAMYELFQAQRDQGAKVTWLPVDDLAHERPAKAEAFFLRFLSRCAGNPDAVWVSNRDRAVCRTEVALADRRSHSWLPETLLTEWMRVAAKW